MKSAIKTFCLSVAIITSLIPIPSVMAQTVQPHSLESYRSIYETAAAKITADVQSQKEDALIQYGRALDSAMTICKKKGDIDNFGIIDAEAKRYATDKTVSTNATHATHPEVVNAVAKYQKQITDADIDLTRRQITLLKKYITALNGLVKEMMTQNKIDDAKAAGNARKAAESKLGEMESQQPKPMEPAKRIDLSGKWLDGRDSAVNWDVTQTENRLMINWRNEKWEGIIETNGTIKLNCHNNKRNWNFIAQLSPDRKKLSGIVTWIDGESKEWCWLREVESRNSTPLGKKSVPEGAVEFRGHHYKFYASAFTWREAKRECEKVTGHLVTISDAEECDLVNRVARERCCWIGFTSEGWTMRHIGRVRKTENDFRWIDNTPFRFSAWWEGDPNGGNVDNYGCIWYWRHGDNNRWLTWGWQDAPNDYKRLTGYICEWDY